VAVERNCRLHTRDARAVDGDGDVDGIREFCLRPPLTPREPVPGTPRGFPCRFDSTHNFLATRMITVVSSSGRTFFGCPYRK
jgi:hypothetical protein